MLATIRPSVMIPAVASPRLHSQALCLRLSSLEFFAPYDPAIIVQASRVSLSRITDHRSRVTPNNFPVAFPQKMCYPHVVITQEAS
jgi:hypothetical protein